MIVYIGLTIFFYSIDKEDREKQKVNNEEGVIDIIIIAISPLACIYCKFIEYKSKRKSY